MHPLRRIRLQVFQVSQTEMGRIAGVWQTAVSGWETGRKRPSMRSLERIRAEALRRGLAWDDSWFFEDRRAA